MRSQVCEQLVERRLVDGSVDHCAHALRVRSDFSIHRIQPLPGLGGIIPRQSTVDLCDIFVESGDRVARNSRSEVAQYVFDGPYRSRQRRTGRVVRRPVGAPDRGKALLEKIDRQGNEPCVLQARNRREISGRFVMDAAAVAVQHEHQFAICGNQAVQREQRIAPRVLDASALMPGNLDSTSAMAAGEMSTQLTRVAGMPCCETASPITAPLPVATSSIVVCPPVVNEAKVSFQNRLTAGWLTPPSV